MLFVKNNKPCVYFVKHINGLEIPEGSTCEVIVANDIISIKANALSINLSIDKINDISFEMDVDIQKYSKSSKLGGVIGAVAFGVPGAIIGSSPKTKTKKTVTGCLVINYTSKSGDTNYLLFKDATPNSMQSAKLHVKIKSLLNNCTIKSIDL